MLFACARLQTRALRSLPYGACTCMHIVRGFYPHSLKRSTTNTRKGPQTCFSLRPPSNACVVIPSLQRIHTYAHRKRLYPHSLEQKYYKHNEATSNLFFACARLQNACIVIPFLHCIHVHAHACTSYDSSQREQATTVLQQARFCHKCPFPL